MEAGEFGQTNSNVVILRYYISGGAGPAKEIEDGRAEDIVYMNFSKVFDMVPRSKLTSKCVEYMGWDVMLQLYRTFVRPLLEYCIQFWSPCYRKDVIKLERVQKRFTSMLLGLEGLSYRERLNRLGLFSLEHWRLRGNRIEVYKIMRGMDR
eukprot:g25423.t1